MDRPSLCHLFLVGSGRMEVFVHVVSEGNQMAFGLIDERCFPSRDSSL